MCYLEPTWAEMKRERRWSRGSDSRRRVGPSLLRHCLPGRGGTGTETIVAPVRRHDGSPSELLSCACLSFDRLRGWIGRAPAAGSSLRPCELPALTYSERTWVIFPGASFAVGRARPLPLSEKPFSHFSFFFWCLTKESSKYPQRMPFSSFI